MRRTQMSGPYPAAAASAFAFAYIALPMAMLVQLRQQWAGAFWFSIFFSWFGRAISSHTSSAAPWDVT